jgi:hypothetical protein
MNRERTGLRLRNSPCPAPVSTATAEPWLVLVADDDPAVVTPGRPSTRPVAGRVGSTRQQA